jgi:hypothetical protein
VKLRFLPYVCLLGFDMTGIFNTRVVVNNNNFGLQSDIGFSTLRNQTRPSHHCKFWQLLKERMKK